MLSCLNLSESGAWVLLALSFLSITPFPPEEYLFPEWFKSDR